MTDIVQGFRQALQDILTPEVRELKAEVIGLRSEMNVQIGGLRSEMNAQIGGLRAEIQAEVGVLRAEMKAEIGGVRAEVDGLRERVEALSEKFDGLRTEMHNGFHLLQMTLENAVLRGDKENIREMADLRERVTRLENQPQRSLTQ